MNKEQLDRTLGLLGKDFENVLNSKRIAVFGLGGVGGTALEALARTGFNKFVIVDCDIVNLSNLNRQILYTQKDIGKTKVCAAEERLKAINSDTDVKTFNERIDETNILNISKENIDFIVDAIDDVNGKIAIAKFAFEKHIPLIVSLGMANRFEPSSVEVIRLDKTTNDPLARKFRHELKAIGIDTASIMAVCSKELPIKNEGKLNSTMMVPSSAGLNIASYIVDYFNKEAK